MKNRGKQIEIDICNELNNKRFINLNKNFQRFIIDIFGKPTIWKIKAYPYENTKLKPDIVICYKKQKILLSVKTNSACHIHMESLKTFISFLKSLGISTRTLKLILFFHFGDGTLNGTGTKRLDYIEVFTKYRKVIEEINYELNKDKNIVLKCVERFLFKGTQESNEEIDYIYHGNLEYGVVVSKKQILKHISRKNYTKINNPHIGPIMFFPYARYAGREETYPEKRFVVNFKWARMPFDLNYIYDTYDK